MDANAKAALLRLIDDAQVSSLSDRAFRLYLYLVASGEVQGHYGVTSLRRLRGRVFWGEVETVSSNDILKCFKEMAEADLLVESEDDNGDMAWSVVLMEVRP